MQKTKVTVGDQIRMVKTPMMNTQTSAIYGFRIGECYTVTEATEEVIVAKNGAFGVCMSHDELNRYFVIQKKFKPAIQKEEPKKKKKIKPGKWSDWTPITIGGKQYSYRTNGKKVVLRGNGYRGESSCHDEDTFKLAEGLSVAYQRLVASQVKKDFIDFFGLE